jgi:cold shock CspA family protein
MRLTGTLRTWHDDRGFGFIAPTHGGAELFVHISALPRDGTRPTVGEKLRYELGRGNDGRPQAINVVREAIGIAPRKSAVYAPKRSVSGNTSIGPKIVAFLLLLAIGAYGYRQYDNRVSQYKAKAESESPAPAAAEVIGHGTQSSSFQCDGRTHCSQMTSCAEAKLFLKNCSGTQMDGNNDGVPCEQQWCTGLLRN